MDGQEEEERVSGGLDMDKDYYGAIGKECQDEKEDTSLKTEQFVVNADAVGGHGTESSVPSPFQSTATQEKLEDTLGIEDGISPVKKVEEDGRGSTLQETVSASQDPVVLDSQLDSASLCGQPSNSYRDMKDVPSIPEVGLAQEPRGQSGSQEHCESYHPDGTEKEAKKKTSTEESGMCTEKASSGIPGAPSRQDEGDPATHQTSKCPPASTAARQSYKASSGLESRSSRDVTKEKRALLKNPEILPPVRKKSRTFYSTEQLGELEKMFEEDHYPDNEKRREIAAVVGVTPQRILVWFQNRRAKWRKSEKLNVKGNKKYSTSSALSAPFGSDRAPALPVPDAARDQSAVLRGDTTAGNCSSLLRAHPAPLTSTSASSVAGMVAPSEAVQTKALPQPSYNSSRVECFPSLPSPPPIRRASLPLNVSFNPQSHVVPLVLDTPNSECTLSTQENGSREAFAYNIHNQSLSSSVSCHYPEQLQPTGNLETMYCPYSSQGGIHQLSQYSQQPQLSQFHHLSGHLATNVLSSDHLPPPMGSSVAPLESHPAFLTLPGNTGAVTYGATQGYGQAHMEGQLVPQQPSGNSADLTAYQAVPWSEFNMQRAPFPNHLHSQMPFSSTAGGQFFTEPYLLQVPNGTALGSMPQAEKQKEVALHDQGSYQSHQTEPELASLAEREDIESSSKKGEIVVGN